VDKAKYQALPDDLQAIIRDVCQAEYDQVASDFAANDPRALQTLINDHGVIVRQFPDEIVEAGAKAALEVMTGLRDSSDDLTKRTAESFIAALNIMRVRTEDTDGAFVEARRKYFKI
jgi:TRAP-type mannitol/chloroaromatic compound transport system substrate-binding protein